MLLTTGRLNENISGLILRCAMDASPNAQLAVHPKVRHRGLLTFVPLISWAAPWKFSRDLLHVRPFWAQACENKRTSQCQKLGAPRKTIQQAPTAQWTFVIGPTIQDLILGSAMDAHLSSVCSAVGGSGFGIGRLSQPRPETRSTLGD